MDVLTLIGEARAEGLTVQVEGESLLLRGPASLAPLAKQLGERKSDVVAALTKKPEVGCVTSRRLIGNGFPPKTPAPVPPEIIADRIIFCAECGTGRVMHELSSLTGGWCWTCWSSRGPQK